MIKLNYLDIKIFAVIAMILMSILLAFGGASFIVNAVMLKNLGASGTNVTNDAYYQTMSYSVPVVNTSGANSGGIVVWMTTDQNALTPAGERGIMAQRYNASGTAVWGSPVQLLGYSSNLVLNAVVSDGNDGAIIVYSPLNSNTRAMRIDSSGTILWHKSIMGLSTSVVGGVDVEVDKDNFVYVVSDGAYFRVQKLDIDGNLYWGSDGAYVSADDPFGAVGSYAEIQPLDNGGAAVVWVDGDTFAQVIDSAGDSLASDIVVSNSAVGREGYTGIVLADAPNFFVIFGQETGVNNFIIDLKVQKYSELGAELFTSGGMTIESNLAVSTWNNYIDFFIEPIGNKSYGSAIIILESKMYRVDYDESVAWNISFDPSSLRGMMYSVEATDEIMTFNDGGLLDGGAPSQNGIITRYDFHTGALKDQLEITDPVAGSISNYYSSIYELPVVGDFYMSWLFRSNTDAIGQNDVFIQRISSTYTEIEYFVTNVLDANDDVYYTTHSVKAGATTGVKGYAVDLMARAKDTFFYDVALIKNVDMTADRDWGTLVVDVDRTNKKSFVDGIASLEGVPAVEYDLYIPKTDSDDTGIIICPDATSLAEVTTSCTNQIVMTTADANLSVNGNYYVLTNNTYKGAMENPLYKITMTAALDANNDATGDNFETVLGNGTYDVNIVRTSDSFRFAQVSVDLTADRSWVNMRVDQSADLSKHYFHYFDLAPGIGATYDLYIPRDDVLDDYLYTCPSVTSINDISTGCAGRIDIAFSDPNLSQATIGGQDYWVYSNTDINNLSKTYAVSVTPGDILIIYNDDGSYGYDASSKTEMFNVLDTAGYDVVLYSLEGVPDASVLNQYKMVIYTSGESYELDAGEIAILEDYIDNGVGRIFFEGEEILWDASNNDPSYPNFTNNYLRVDDSNQDSGDVVSLTVTNGAHPITQGLTSPVNHSSSSGYSDGLIPINGSASLMDADWGSSVFTYYDNGLSCSQNKKTALFGGVWQNSMLGIDDVTFRETLLKNIVDWMLDAPCVVQNLDPGFNITADINTIETDLTTTGASGTVSANLKANITDPILDIDVDLTENRDWSTLSIQTNSLEGKTYSGNILTMPGAGTVYDLYVPIPAGSESITEVVLCFSATGTSDTTADCAGGEVLADGGSATILGQSLTANIVGSYWEITGLEQSVGITLNVATVPPSDGGSGGGGGIYFEDPTDNPFPFDRQEGEEVIIPEDPTPEDPVDPTPDEEVVIPPIVVQPPVNNGGTNTPIQDPNQDSTDQNPETDINDEVDRTEEDVIEDNSNDQDENTVPDVPVTDTSDPTDFEGSDQVSNASESESGILGAISGLAESNETPAILAASTVAVIALVEFLSIASAARGDLFGLAFAYIVKGRRKFWGITYDSKTFNPVSLSVVRLVNPVNNKIIAYSVSNLDGKYGFVVDESGQFILEAQAAGYGKYTKNVTLKEGEVLIQDIPLIEENVEIGFFESIGNIFKSPGFKRIMNYVFMLLSVAGLFLTLYVVFVEGSTNIVNILLLLFYIILLAFNVNNIRKMVKFEAGKVLDATTGQPIPGVNIRFFRENHKTDVAITNKLGVIKINIPFGDYSVLISKNGYEQENREIVISEEGYIKNTLNLNKSENGVDNFYSPFG